MSEATAVAIRGVLTFLSLLVLSRVLGKAHMAQLTFFEYVGAITIGSIASELTIDTTSRPWPMFVGLLVWTSMTLLAQFTSLKSRWLGQMLDGEPVIVIQNGQILEKNLGMLRLRAGDLQSMLRQQGIFDPKEVEFAILETRGDLSVLKRSQYRSVSAKDLNLPTEYEGISIELVVDGQIQHQNLKRMNMDIAWLKQHLKAERNARLEDVYYASINSQGKLYVDTFRDRIAKTDDLSDYPGPN